MFTEEQAEEFVATNSPLRINYGISRCAGTSGQNTVTCYTGGKKYTVTGGGYDMEGAVLGNWLTDCAPFVDECKKMSNYNYSCLIFCDTETRKRSNDYRQGCSIRIDGRVGVSCVMSLFREVTGCALVKVSQTSRQSVYQIRPDLEQEVDGHQPGKAEKDGGLAPMAFLQAHQPYTADAKKMLLPYKSMRQAWNALVRNENRYWLIFILTQQGVVSPAAQRRLACRFVRETPLHDGRRIWDLLSDRRSKAVVEMAENYADGKTTEEELERARKAAYSIVQFTEDMQLVLDESVAPLAATQTAGTRLSSVVNDTSFQCVSAVFLHALAVNKDLPDVSAAVRAAHVAHVKMIAELGNPFEEE